MASWKRIAERAEARVKELEEELECSITWSVEDFENRAVDIENNNDKKFDRELFQDALNRMIYKHDACYGICYDTIDYYLYDQCEIKSDD